jgi:hypothetical protein
MYTYEERRGRELGEERRHKDEANFLRPPERSQRKTRPKPLAV